MGRLSMTKCTYLPTYLPTYLDIPAPFDGLRVFNRDSIKPYIHRQGQPVWKFPMPLF